jgi:hypothetical protein
MHRVEDTRIAKHLASISARWAADKLKPVRSAAVTQVQARTESLGAELTITCTHVATAVLAITEDYTTYSTRQSKRSHQYL